MSIGKVNAQSKISIEGCTGCCNTTLDKTSTYLIINFLDPCMWGSLAEIRPHDSNGNIGSGKMYPINSSTGQLYIPKNHGYYLNGGYTFSFRYYIKDQITSLCGCSFYFQD